MLILTQVLHNKLMYHVIRDPLIQPHPTMSEKFQISLLCVHQVIEVSIQPTWVKLTDVKYDTFI